VEIELRLFSFIAVFTAFALAELYFPRRQLITPRKKRWPTNIGLTFISVLIFKIALPISLVAYADHGWNAGWGLIPALGISFWATVFISVIALDLVIYVQHLAFHHNKWLWRLHRVHHTDKDFDLTTALRFHPLEILISLGIKFIALTILGAPPEAVLLFEILLSSSALFSHSNIKLPSLFDSGLRYVLVTPDMHRVHHSVLSNETNSNFGFCLPFWDRLFRTYRAQPKQVHTLMDIGLTEFREDTEAGLSRLLTQPFRYSQSK
jgi:sterol desaturase/sphingolipid hydroxylase (fatty acid hydroxylase superfamily)